MGKSNNTNKSKKLGKGIRYTDNGRIEGYGTVHNKRGDSIKYSFVRDTVEEVEYMKAKIKLLGILDKNVVKIKVDKFTDEIQLIRKRTRKKKWSNKFK